MAEHAPPPPGPPPLEGGSQPPVGPPPLGAPQAPIGAPRYRPEPRRRWRWWFAVPIALAVYLLLVAVTLVQPVHAAGYSFSVPIPGVSTAQLFGLPDRPFTVLIVGLDIRPHEQGPSRTDSIVLLRVDPEKNRAALLSVPRDAMMQIPLPGGDSMRDRVNAAYSLNWSSEDKGAAMNALVQALEQNLGVEIDYTVRFNQRGAAKIIDAAGGVTIHVRQSFGQDDYSDDDVHVVPQYFEKGVRHLDGYQAVAYGRIREGSSDFERMQRQQQVAEALVDQLSSLRAVRKLPDVWDAFRDGVTTDLSMRESAGLFVLLKRIGTERVVTYSLGDATVPCYSCAGALLLLVPEEVARIVGKAFDDPSAGQAAAQRLVAAGVTP